MSYSGYYHLQVVCDHLHKEHDVKCSDGANFTGNTQGAAILKARAAGWYVSNKGNKCLCPEHYMIRPR